MSRTWQDAQGIPDALQATLDRADGLAETAELFGSSKVRRILASGNGASFYVAHYLSMLSLAVPGHAPVIAVPAGILAQPWFTWQPGDALLAFSSSGELNDLITARSETRTVIWGAVTASPQSTLARNADTVALVQVPTQRGMTHTQAYCGAALVALSVWARVTKDASLAALARDAPGVSAQAIAEAEACAEDVDMGGLPTAAIAYGSGCAWSAALEAALLMKEVAGIPCEGTETREGATSAMFPLTSNHIALSLHTKEDRHIEATDRVCRATGARVVPVMVGTLTDQRLAPITTFFAALLFALKVGAFTGQDPDNPPWGMRYVEAVRSAPA